jgi:nitroimidazol reductase NimA-like FMN-containing flavoprotein (pyridoxamine 5'-phosphate oxidase superfamily)
MAARATRTEMEVLSPEECLGLLAAHHLGRIAVLADGYPEIYPVNYAVLDGAVVFNSAPGSKVHAALEHAHVGFEVDGGPDHGPGAWSVLAVGDLQELQHPRWLVEGVAELLGPWRSSPGDHWLCIRPIRISGRRLA